MVLVGQLCARLVLVGHPLFSIPQEICTQFTFYVYEDLDIQGLFNASERCVSHSKAHPVVSAGQHGSTLAC